MNFDKIMANTMTYAMLDCNKATFLITKKEYQRLSCTERVKLKAHLMACKYCRLFAEQTKFISNELLSFKQIDINKLTLTLSAEQKSNIQNTIDKQVFIK